MSIPGFLTPFPFPQCPWISAHWLFIFISIRQGLKKIKGIKFKTNPFPYFRRKKVGNTWPETITTKKGNYWSISRPMFPFSEFQVVWCSPRSFCPVALSAHTQVSLSLSVLLLPGVFLSFAFLSTSELQVFSKLAGLSASEVSGMRFQVLQNFLHSHINQIFSTSAAQSKVSGSISQIIIAPWWNCVSSHL